jgi:threonine/homoserine/homoserine lactone efflux protein
MVDMSLVLSLCGFAVISSITPGPNNLMLMSSSALFGWRRTMPHLLGVVTGFAVLMASAVLGLGALVQRWPWLVTAVKVGGALWLSWMAWQYIRTGIRLSSGIRYPDDVRTSRPFRLHEAMLFQWANPKAVLLAISTAGAYVGISDSIVQRASIIVGIYFFVGAPCVITWMVAGDVIKRMLTRGSSAALINALMGLLILVTAAVILFS